MGREKDDASGNRRRPASQIDENLKRVYREMEEETLPDRFRDLIEQLRKQDGQS